MNQEEFDYRFPPELVAQKPASPRDSAKLLVYDRATGKTAWDAFRNIAKRLPPRSVLVVNETKVIPARLTLRKPTGGRVKILYLAESKRSFTALADRALQQGTELSLGKLRFRVQGKKGQAYDIRPDFPMSRLPGVLDGYGETPIPPYIKHPPLQGARLRDAYQAVFAKRKGSVAAPTASLHFTKGLLEKIRRAGHDIRFVTLHVGLGTFAPVTPEQIASGRLHEERFEIDPATAAALNRAKKEKRPIVAVGTTVVRTLESSSDARGRIARRKGSTDLFIRPGYKFRFVDAVITNFHVPRSSLLMLVSAFASRERILALYREAVRRRFRLFSFGDGMLIR